MQILIYAPNRQSPIAMIDMSWSLSHRAHAYPGSGPPNNYSPWYLPPSSNFLEGLSLRTPLKLVSLLDDGTCVGRSGISLSSSAAAAALASSAVSVANTIGNFRSTHPVSDCE